MLDSFYALGFQNSGSFLQNFSGNHNFKAIIVKKEWKLWNLTFIEFSVLPFLF